MLLLKWYLLYMIFSNKIFKITGFLSMELHSSCLDKDL